PQTAETKSLTEVSGRLVSGDATRPDHQTQGTEPQATTGAPSGSSNPNEEAGPYSPAVLPDLRDGLADQARRRADRRGRPLRPDGPRQGESGEAEPRTHRLLDGRRRSAFREGRR